MWDALRRRVSQCGDTVPQGILAVAIPCGRGYLVIAPTLRRTRVCSTLRWLDRPVAQWGTSTPSTPGSSRGCAAWSSPPPPWCTTAPMLQHAMLPRGAPCCNIARNLATFCAILQHSARSCICGLRLRASRCAACNVSRGARHGTTWRSASALRAAWDTAPPWDTVPHGIPCRMGYRAAWGVGRPMWRRCETRGGAVSFAARRRACCAWRRGSPAHPHAHQPRHTPSSRCLALSPLSRLAALPLSRSPT
jgi:hypothetical protein